MITYLAKLGELTLKGSNLHEFEKLLIKNTRESLKGYDVKITLHAGRLYIDCQEQDSSAVEFALKHLLGITGWAKTTTCEKNIEAIQKAIYKEAEYAVSKGAKTFKIEARRADKQFPLDSYQIACQGASLVFDSGFMNVDVKNPDVKIYVKRGRLNMIVSLKLESGQKLTDATGEIQTALTSAFRDHMGVEKLGKIDVRVLGFKGLIYKPTNKFLPPVKDEPLDESPIIDIVDPSDKKE